MKNVFLKDICTPEKGKQIDTNLLNNNNEYKYINGGVKESGYYSKYNTQGGVVIVSEGGASCGFVNFIRDPFWCGCHCYRLMNSKLKPLYLYYLLKGNQAKIMALRTGAAMPNIKKSSFEKLSLNVDFDEGKQRVVIDCLSQIEEAIKDKQKQLSLFDELTKSRFIEMFGDPDANPFDWEIVTINDVCSSIVRGPFGSALKKEFFVPKSETTIKVYEQQHAIKKNDKLGTYYVTKEKYQSLKRFTCHEGDILMSCSGTMGELYQLPIGCEQGIINQALCKFTLNQKMLPIVFLESMKHVVDQIDKKGSGIQNIAAVSYVKSMKICLPPIQIQKKFVSFYEQIDKSKFVVHSKYFLWEFLTLFSSTMAYSSVVSILA